MMNGNINTGTKYLLLYRYNARGRRPPLKPPHIRRIPRGVPLNPPRFRYFFSKMGGLRGRSPLVERVFYKC